MAAGLMYCVDPNDLLHRFNTHTADFYIDVFDQRGGALPHFQGTHTQRGQGFLGDLFRHYAVPLISRAAPHIAKKIGTVIKDISKSRDHVRKKETASHQRAANTVLRGHGNFSKAPVKRVKKATNRKNKKRKVVEDFPLFS